MALERFMAMWLLQIEQVRCFDGEGETSLSRHVVTKGGQRPPDEVRGVEPRTVTLPRTCLSSRRSSRSFFVSYERTAAVSRSFIYTFSAIIYRSEFLSTSSGGSITRDRHHVRSRVSPVTDVPSHAKRDAKLIIVLRTYRRQKVNYKRPRMSSIFLVLSTASKIFSTFFSTIKENGEFIYPL